jgi:hypothetical protein
VASSSKKRTTMAKMARENKLRERRAEKQARKDARKFAAANPTPAGETDEPVGPDEASAQADVPASTAESETDD